ncbi:MAG TPA: hypothetical protein ENN69_07670 [Spirochaetia bacterium]|nr:hypothetical protein [Spirochaetia bacterium]
MGQYFDQIPPELQNHVKGLVKSVNVEEGVDALEKVSQAWLEKKSVFEEKTAGMDMEEIDRLAADDSRAALALTYSGSLVNIGPLIDGVRNVRYSSIGFRTNTPDSAESDKSKLESDVETNSVISFSGGPVKSTSQIFKIAVCKDEDMSPEEQQQTIFDAGEMIEEEFIEVNKTVMEEEE